MEIFPHLVPRLSGLLPWRQWCWEAVEGREKIDYPRADLASDSEVFKTLVTGLELPFVAGDDAHAEGDGVYDARRETLELLGKVV